jgi:alpha-ketoglutarate-dependent taurine dioxygenase
MQLEPGDIQWLHNHTCLHARDAYSDDITLEPSR